MIDYVARAEIVNRREGFGHKARDEKRGYIFKGWFKCGNLPWLLLITTG